jgi:hypothetical protein
MESKQERICSEETLEMLPQTHDDQAENFDKICLPPVMQAQVEIITTSAILLPMQKEILKHLSDLVKAKDRPVRWFTLYLSMFLLLHSCALLTKAQHRRARRHNPVGSLVRIRLPEDKIHELTRNRYDTTILLLSRKFIWARKSCLHISIMPIMAASRSRWIGVKHKPQHSPNWTKNRLHLCERL